VDLGRGSLSWRKDSDEQGRHKGEEANVTSPLKLAAGKNLSQTMEGDGRSVEDIKKQLLFGRSEEDANLENPSN
jgi:hypothetical protein